MERERKKPTDKIRLLVVGAMLAGVTLLVAACGGGKQSASADLAIGSGQTQQQSVEGSVGSLKGEKAEVVLVGLSEQEREQAEKTRRNPAPVVLEKVAVTVSFQAEKIGKLLEDGSALGITIQNPQLNEMREVFDGTQGGQLQVEKTWEFGPDSMLRSLTGDWKVSFDGADLQNVKYTITVSAVRS